MCIRDRHQTPPVQPRGKLTPIGWGEGVEQDIAEALARRFERGGCSLEISQRHPELIDIDGLGEQPMLAELRRNELAITEACQEKEGNRHPVEIGANRETRSAVQIDVDHGPVDMAFLEEGLARFDVSNGACHLVSTVANKVANGIGQ